MRLSLVQFESGPDTDANLATAERLITRAATAENADLVVLPEVWNVGYFDFDAYEAKAEPLDGPTATRLAALADEHGVHLHAGSIVERDGADCYNTSLLFGPDGERLASYRKVHLFGYDSEERRRLTAGREVVVAETPLGTLGLATCYDLRFPELFRAMVEEGVEVFLIASAWPQVRLDHWRLLTEVRAVEEQAVVAAANLAGTNAGTQLAGHSRVVDPWGVARVDAGAGERVVTAQIDGDEVREARAEFPALADRQLSLSYEF